MPAVRTPLWRRSLPGLTPTVTLAAANATYTGSAYDTANLTTTVTPTDEGQTPNAPALATYILYRVDVRVDWTSGGGQPRQLSLGTLELGPRPQ